MVAAAVSYTRALVLVSLILSVSSASHVLASGHLPAPGVILLLGALLLVPITLLGRRTLSFRSSVLAMGAGQFVLHHVFGMTAVSAVCQRSSALPDHHAAFELACSPVAQEQMGTVGGPMMVLLHGIATILLALAVSRSDAAVALLRAWLRPLLALPAVVFVAPSTKRLLMDGPAPVAPLSVHASVPTLRGPPRAVVSPV